MFINIQCIDLDDYDDLLCSTSFQAVDILFRIRSGLGQFPELNPKAMAVFRSASLMVKRRLQMHGKDADACHDTQLWTEQSHDHERWMAVVLHVNAGACRSIREYVCSIFPIAGMPGPLTLTLRRQLKVVPGGLYTLAQYLYRYYLASHQDRQSKLCWTIHIAVHG